MSNINFLINCFRISNQTVYIKGLIDAKRISNNKNKNMSSGMSKLYAAWLICYINMLWSIDIKPYCQRSKWCWPPLPMILMWKISIELDSNAYTTREPSYESLVDNALNSPTLTTSLCFCQLPPNGWLIVTFGKFKILFPIVDLFDKYLMAEVLTSNFLKIAKVSSYN
uniref:Uncharacterized protein n=1 Tax=Glossina palpalis gambiensis TaxID=67801 RepID=A0A1B0BB00_9MUSC